MGEAGDLGFSPARHAGEGGPDFVPVNDRVAVFDNDGTLWWEMPVPVQAYFADDHLGVFAPRHPEWLTTEPFKSKLAGDMKGVMAEGIAELAMATDACMTTEEFEAILRERLSTAKHPELGRPYTEVVYQPMLEVLGYLRDHGFSTFIVSGGGVEFMRVFAEETYGRPRSGSSALRLKPTTNCRGENQHAAFDEPLKM
jgi:phosphoglycolate phosphatase-like HAD superfamily hydrolase